MIPARSVPPCSPLVALLLCAALAGCAGGGDDDDDGCDPLPNNNLSTLQAQIFTPSCGALSSCHDSLAPAGPGLNLTEGATHAETVGVTATQLFEGGTVEFVDVAGGHEASYLWLKVAGDPGIQGNAMPDTGQTLCQEKIDAIAAWIDAGALDN